MREPKKESRRPYGFLLDRDVIKAATLFPKGRTYTIAQIGLKENASDAKIVSEAWERELTIVTANGDDFVKEIISFQKKTKAKDCREMYGLVVLPNAYEDQQRLIPIVEKKLRFGSKKSTWKDVSHMNLLVRIERDGRLQIRRFPRCFYCEKSEIVG